MGAAAESATSRVGMIASVACAIHCALMPIALGAGASGALSFLRHEPVEWAMVGFAALVGLTAAWKGARSHGNIAVVATLVVAVATLVAHATHIFESGHDHAGHGHAHLHEAVHADGIAWSGVIGGVLLAGALFAHNRLARACNTCDHHVHEPHDHSAA